MGIFALTNAFFLGFESVIAILMLAFYVGNSGFAWYMAHVARKKMSEYVIVQSAGYFLKHIVLSVMVVIGTSLIWVSGIIPDSNMLTTILTINYLVMFMTGMWFIITRTDFSKSLFTIFDLRAFIKAKELIIGMMKAKPRFFGRYIVAAEEIRGYSYGSVKEVDENMISAWKNRKKAQYVMECIGRVQLSLAKQALVIIKEKLSYLRVQVTGPKTESMMIKSENELKRKTSDIAEFEERFFQRTGESELL